MKLGNSQVGQLLLLGSSQSSLSSEQTGNFVENYPAYEEQSENAGPETEKSF